MHPVEAHSLVDAIARQLEGAIFSGELAPGAKLSELGLAKRLGVSRGPLREAIRRLEGRKLIQRIPNIGARVAELSPRDLHDVLVVREALEGMACRCAAEQMDDGEISSLRDLLNEHGRQEAVSAGTGYYQEGKDFDFHFRIIKASKNERLIGMLCNDLYDLLRVYRYKSSTLQGRARKAFHEHEVIVDALAGRDPDRAEAAMRRHLRNARAHIEKRAAAKE
ncbi:GntR family transcriptional regulator [Methylocella tundrae]|uniref:GntR family transcriptional regulator n=1 Tax=Methylocella tundrae TaxID=227605 RepID=A0A8B6M7X3_METTU|nr:GntR family transcriptional regulator [Methylocella tundrae]VTZ51133.1 GntR family transcriptional regulator [Methylocella tundrae]